MIPQKHITQVRDYVSHIQLSILMQFSLLCTLILLANYVFIDEEISESQRTITNIEQSTTGDPFSLIDIEAQAVYVWDMKTGEVLYSQNEDFIYPLASITKVATVLTADRLIQHDAIVTITNEAVMVDGDNGLLTGEKWNLQDLLDFTLVVSSNDGAHGIASVAGVLLTDENFQIENTEDSISRFVDEMNVLAEEIGLEKTRFYNPSGLDINDNRSGAYGSAKDVTKLIAHTLEHRPELLEATKKPQNTFVSLNDLSHPATNTNPTVSSVPGILASKTGYTDLSGGNLVIALDPFPGRPIIITVLGSTYDGRFDDVEKLSEAAIETIRNKK